MCREAPPRISNVDRLLNPELEEPILFQAQTNNGWFQQTIDMPVDNNNDNWWNDAVDAIDESHRIWNVFDGYEEPIDDADWLQIWERCTQALADAFDEPMDYREWRSARITSINNDSEGSEEED
jgi:hypothetical protein